MVTLTSSYQYIGRTNGVKAYNKSYYYYILLYAKTSGSTTTGKHTVTVLMRLACTKDSTFYDYKTTASLKVGDTTAFSWDSAKIPGSSWSNSSEITVDKVTYKRHVDLKSASVEVDTKFASKEITITASWSRDALSKTPPDWLPKTTKAEASITVKLPTIASASVPTVSASSATMGNSVTITTNRKSTSLTHDLTYSFGTATGTIATGVGESYKWTVPDLVSKISGKKSGTCTITCNTKSGSTVIGTKTVSITLNVPAASSPTVSASSVQMGNSVTITTNRKSSGYTHKLTYKIGTQTGDIGTGITTSKEWTPPKSLAAYTGKKTSATCTITCETYNGTLLIGSNTIDITLTVPNATVPTLSASTVALGSSVKITLSREASVYTHSLTYSLKANGSTTVAASGTIGNADTELSWTVPLSLAAKISSATKGTITLTCQTLFSGSTTVVGTKTASFEVTVPNNSTTKPKVTMTVSAAETPFSGLYVAGKSKVKVTYTATSDYSTIKSYATTVLNASGSTNPYTSAVLANAGTVEIKGKVTDARGYYSETKQTITVIDYGRPRIIPGSGQNKIICTRGNSDGNVDPGGAYLLVKMGRKYSKVVSGGVQKNYCKLSYRWKSDAAGDDEYSTPKELLAREASSDYVEVILSDVVSSNTMAYNIQLIAEDDVGEKDVVTITIPTAFATFHVPQGGHGFTLGGYHDPAKVDVFDCRFDAEFQGDVSGRVLGMGALPEIPEGADANDYKEFGVYAITTNVKAKSMINLPAALAGILRVWSANGTGLTSGNMVYIMQEYIPYDNSVTYRRLLQLQGNSWEYFTWKAI